MYRSGICDGTCWIEFGFTLSLKLLNMRMSPLVHPYEWGKGAECIPECICESCMWSAKLLQGGIRKVEYRRILSTMGVVLKYLQL